MVHFSYPYDVSVMTDGRMIISDTHRVMLMYINTTIIHVWGSLAQGQALGQFDYPLAVASDGYIIYVADYSNYRIQVLNVTSTDDIGEIRGTVGEPYVSYKPRGVAIDTESGDIFVTCEKSDGYIIIIYNMVGHYVRHVTTFDLVVDLRHITLYRGQVYVGDVYNDCVHVLSYTGSYIQKIGYTDTSIGCFQDPYGIAVHSVTGHLIVTDNHNVHVHIFQHL